MPLGDKKATGAELLCSGTRLRQKIHGVHIYINPTRSRTGEAPVGLQLGRAPAGIRGGAEAALAGFRPVRGHRGRGRGPLLIDAPVRGLDVGAAPACP